MFFFKNGRNKESNKNEVECLVVEPLIQEIYKNHLQRIKIMV